MVSHLSPACVIETKYRYSELYGSLRFIAYVLCALEDVFWQAFQNDSVAVNYLFQPANTFEKTISVLLFFYVHPSDCILTCMQS